MHTILIKRGIVIIASSNERTSSSSAKICSSMVLKQRKSKRSIVKKIVIISDQPNKQSQINHHIIINEWSPILNEPCNGVSHVFCRSIRNWTAKFRVPEVSEIKQHQEKLFSRKNSKIKGEQSHNWMWKRMRKTLNLNERKLFKEKN